MKYPGWIGRRYAPARGAEVSSKAPIRRNLS